MASKFKFLFKWSFVFTILGFWTLLVIGSLATGTATGFLTKEFEDKIYLSTSTGIERASSTDLVDILFNHDFTLETKKEDIPMKDCSLRAKDGIITIDGKSLERRNKLSFNANHLPTGKGSLRGSGSDRFSIKFNIEEVLEINNKTLELNASGSGKLNREKLNFDSIVIKLNKIENKVDISGSGEKDFEASNMEVSRLKGCLTEERKFLLITYNGELAERRSIEEVRQILTDNPEFIDEYENLRRLFRDYWWLVLPGTGGFVS